MKIKLEIATLEKSKKDKITPRGLRFQKTPSSEKDDPEFISGWNLLLEGFSMTMMDYVIQKRKEKLPKINNEVELLSKQIEQEFSSEAITDIYKILGEKLEKIETEVLTIKKRKYERDVADYKRGNIHRSYEESRTQYKQPESTITPTVTDRWVEVNRRRNHPKANPYHNNWKN